MTKHTYNHEIWELRFFVDGRQVVLQHISRCYVYCFNISIINVEMWAHVSLAEQQPLRSEVAITK